VIAIITTILGIVSTVLAWTLNPKRRLYAELDSIYKELEVLYEKRDKALQEHDGDTLTIVTASIIKLRDRKASIFQRLR